MTTMNDSAIRSVGRNAQENANLIWNVANTLFGAFKPHEYGLVILPMCVIKRFHDCLIKTQDKVLATAKKNKKMDDKLKPGFLKKASGYQVQYSLKKNMSGARTIKVKGASKTKCTIPKLKSGKKYYVKVRPIKTKAGQTYIGVLSKVKAAKAK